MSHPTLPICTSSDSKHSSCAVSALVSNTTFTYAAMVPPLSWRLVAKNKALFPKRSGTTITGKSPFSQLNRNYMSPNLLANKYYAGKKYAKCYCIIQNNVILRYIIMILCQTIVKYYIFIVPLGFPLSPVSYLFILVCYLSGYDIRHYV